MNEMLPLDGPQTKCILMESAINNQFIIFRFFFYIFQSCMQRNSYQKEQIQYFNQFFNFLDHALFSTTPCCMNL